jgi:chromatin remodeling complex protein RSC6
MCLSGSLVPSKPWEPRLPGGRVLVVEAKLIWGQWRTRARLIIKIAFSPAKGQMEGVAKTPKKAKRTPSAAFMKPVQPDDKLALVVGDKPLPRTELTKKLWAYIKKKGLQDAKKRTLINADENLKAVFNGKKQVSMFEMTKLVSGHLKK